MIVSIILVPLILPAFVVCSGDGNIHLLEDEVAAAIKSCNLPYNEPSNKDSSVQRHRRGANDVYGTAPRIDNVVGTEVNLYDHETRNRSDLRSPIQPLNVTDYDFIGQEKGYEGQIPNNSVNTVKVDDINKNRTKRSEQLLNKEDSDQCLSQCVFANLQVVDPRGIPIEVELWNKVQTSVVSQQSRSALHNQIRACFQDLQTEAEDNGCSYSNKLERCLMLRFSDRKLSNNSTINKS